MKKGFVTVAAVALMSVACYGATGGEKALSLKILHFNDHHGHLDQSSKKLKFKNIGKVYTKLGGFPRIATMAKALKAKSKNTLFLNAGDAFSGTLYHTLFHGLASAEMLNKLGIDAFTLGNHEFDNRDEGLRTFIDKAKFPIISSNVVAKDGSVLEGQWKPYIIKDIDGAKVGIIGLEIFQKTRVSSRPSDAITFLDEVKSVQKYADELQGKGINKIILLSHFGYENDLDLASKVTGIDVIIDGDSHTLMGDFSALGLKSQVDTYPKQTHTKDGKPLCIAQAWAHALVLGDLDVRFDAEGNLESCKGVSHLLLGSQFRMKNKKKKKVEVNATVRAKIEGIVGAQENLSIVEPDADMLSALNYYKHLVDQKKNDAIGQSEEDMKHIRIPGHDYGGNSGANMPLGSELAPVVAKGFYEASLRADACIQNAGGVRVSLKSGKISYGDAYTILPFSNTLFEIDMTGSQVKAVLEDALSNFKDEGGSTGSFPYAYGIKYEIDMSKTKGKRISGLEVMDRTTKKWSSMAMDKTYVIVTNNYIAEGRDGYTTFKTVQKNGAKAIDTQLDYAESFVEYVKGLAKEGRGLTKLLLEEHCIKAFKE